MRFPRFVFVAVEPLDARRSFVEKWPELAPSPKKNDSCHLLPNYLSAN